MSAIKLWYMRDDHTFLRLEGTVEEMLSKVMAEFDEGYTGGMLCTKQIPDLGHVQAHGKENRDEFKDAARRWLIAANIRAQEA